MNSYNSNPRYGWDNLSKFLAVISLPFLFSRTSVFTIIGILFVGWAIFRSVSRGNDTRRRREEIIFENWSRQANYWLDLILAKLENLNAGIRNWYLRRRWKAKQRKRFKIVRCPKCSQKLRVPRHKGKLLITCNRCGHKFNEKT